MRGEEKRKNNCHAIRLALMLHLDGGTRQRPRHGNITGRGGNYRCLVGQQGTCSHHHIHLTGQRSDEINRLSNSR